LSATGDGGFVEQAEVFSAAVLPSTAAWNSMPTWRSGRNTRASSRP
jgi:hypothetical protein